MGKFNARLIQTEIMSTLQEVLCLTPRTSRAFRQYRNAHSKVHKAICIHLSFDMANLRYYSRPQCTVHAAVICAGSDGNISSLIQFSQLLETGF
ncbi:hypothetical protein NPIL_365421 [Nephila pilipes]|uniref:Uncharacterized protein n=1 Tax=Nephila pilipes TaxID=299642 RepID=A0A8X6QKA5_NEPPI|nr:hypothetical protein NPIL_365421 [Nephila pilipes]